jgi:glutamate formiminotransferase/formiminotetrahydrofolate cyclodeaminase
MTTLSDFLAELASDSPAPGGGSVAALSGALAAGLTSMVANLTIGKPKYAEAEADMRSVLARSEALRLELEQLIEEDRQAFDRVMAAMKLPKETADDQAKRAAALQSALVDAASVPLDVMGKCVEVISLARVAAEKGNRNAVSDAGVAALMARAGTHAARLNVMINLPGIKSGEHSAFVATARALARDLSASADRGAADVLSTVEAKLG